MIRRIFFGMLVVVWSLGGVDLARAQTLSYPTKPIILQVP